MHVLDTCKNEEDPVKNKVDRVATRLLPFKVYGDFSRRSRAAKAEVRCRILPKFEFIRDFMKNKIKKYTGARVATRFFQM